MEKINSLYFKFLPNDVHCGFFKDVSFEINHSGAVILNALGSLTDELSELLIKEQACEMWIRKSTFTASIVKANIHLNHMIVGLSYHIDSALHSSDLEIVLAAKYLNNMIKSYGRVIKKPYIAKIADVNAILEHLKGDLFNETKKIGVDIWISALESALEEFDSLIKQRYIQMQHKPEEGFSEIRKKIEKVWHAIVQIINAGAVYSKLPEYKVLIDKLNPLITSLNYTYRRIRYDIAKAEIISIKPQYYTGQRHTPVPEVIYVTKKQEIISLILGKDFNVTYKHNIYPGNASCIIHGKGDYKGRKMVSFFIMEKGDI
jgi:hypothetical protein